MLRPPLAVWVKLNVAPPTPHLLHRLGRCIRLLAEHQGVVPTLRWIKHIADALKMDVADPSQIVTALQKATLLSQLERSRPRPEGSRAADQLVYFVRPRAATRARQSRWIPAYAATAATSSSPGQILG